jgi:hypothetical protein
MNKAPASDKCLIDHNFTTHVPRAWRRGRLETMRNCVDSDVTSHKHLTTISTSVHAGPTSCPTGPRSRRRCWPLGIPGRCPKWAEARAQALRAQVLLEQGTGRPELAEGSRALLQQLDKEEGDQRHFSQDAQPEQIRLGRAHAGRREWDRATARYAQAEKLASTGRPRGPCPRRSLDLPGAACSPRPPPGTGRSPLAGSAWTGRCGA